MGEDTPTEAKGNAAASVRGTARRGLKIAILVVGVVLGVVTTVAYLSGGESELAFEYRGFD